MAIVSELPVSSQLLFEKESLKVVSHDLNRKASLYHMISLRRTFSVILPASLLLISCGQTQASKPQPSSSREYSCEMSGQGGFSAIVKPEIPDSYIQGSTCYVPVSAGKCTGQRTHFDEGLGKNDWNNCNPKVITNNGKQFYEFSTSGYIKFLLE